MKKNIQKTHLKVKKNKWSTVITVLLGLWLVAFAFSYLIGGNIDKVSTNARIVFIPIKGFISSEGGSPMLFDDSGASANQVRKYIETAVKDDNIKAIILEINSGGGTVVGSREIASMVEQAKLKKPVVSWIREIGASGAYWIASSSDIIVADPLSITGSIGVTSSYLEYTGFMEEWGLNYVELTSGKYKDVGSPFRELKKEERGILLAKLNKIHDYFIKTVAKNRDLSEEKVEKLSTGIYFLGEEAYDLGLVDYLGGKELAINISKQLAGIEDAELITFEKKKTLLDVLSKLSSQAFYFVGKGIGSSFSHSLKESTNPLRILS